MNQFTVTLSGAGEEENGGRNATIEAGSVSKLIDTVLGMGEDDITLLSLEFGLSEESRREAEVEVAVQALENARDKVREAERGREGGRGEG